MLPLDNIKYHLLSNNTKYFLRFWNEDIDELSFIDSYTNLESINERLVFGEEAWRNKSFAYKHNFDNSIKFCLTQLHEKGRYQKFNGNKSMEDSPRFLIKNNLNLYDNYDEDKGKGESGHAIDYYLYGNNYIFELLKCKNLDEFSNINLFIGTNTLKLKKIINTILNNNKISIKNKFRIKNIHNKKR